MDLTDETLKEERREYNRKWESTHKKQRRGYTMKWRNKPANREKYLQYLKDYCKKHRRAENGKVD